jgi:hypothetical protein
MPLSELTKKQVEKKLGSFCKEKARANLNGELHLDFTFRGNTVTLFERHTAFRKPETWVESVIAQFRFNPLTKEWTLYWADRNSKWHLYDKVGPTTNFEALLAKVDKDPAGIFRG